MKEWLKKYDVLTKALAVLIAVVLWIYVVTVVDPVGEIKLSDIQPTYIGSEELLNAGNLIVGNAEENLVSVRLSGQRRFLSALNEDDIRVEVDISQIKDAGTYSLSYKVVLPSGEISVIDREPSRLSVTIDKIVTATVPVRVVFKGNVAEGYTVGESTTVPSTLSVMGLAEEVNRISYAQVKIGKKDLNTSIHEQMSYVFYDANDKALELNSIQTENRTVIVNFPVLKTKKIPLSIEVVEGGGALEKNVSYEIEPSEITIAGEEKDIDSMQSLVIGVVDLAKISDNATLPMKLTIPENIQNMSGETTADVSLKFSGLSRKSVETTSIEITNIPRGYTIEPLTNSLSVLLRGSEESLGKVLPQNVRAVVDLSGMVLTPGQHTLSARVIIDGAENVGAVGEYKIVLKVTK